MNNLPNYNSFQGVLDSIIRSYLLNELPPEIGESSSAQGSNIRHTSAERDIGISPAGMPIPPKMLQSLNRIVQSQNSTEVKDQGQGRQISGTPVAGTSRQVHSTLPMDANFDQEYIKALYQCFENRGVFKELQTFLRHKLVSILQDEFPSLDQSFEASDEKNLTVLRLVEDFLRCHRLLYTLSVLASEGDINQQHTKATYGKLPAREAENLLDELGIKRMSRVSRQILKCYFDNEHFSLLECMHYLGIWLDGSSTQTQLLESGVDRENSARKKGKSIILSKSKSGNEASSEGEQGDINKENIGGVERTLLELERRMEKEKEFKIKEAVERFKTEEMQKVREELETKLKLEQLEKEKVNLLDMQAKLAEINQEINQERQAWLEVKLNQEKELCELRKQVVLKTAHVITAPSIQTILKEPSAGVLFPSKSSQVTLSHPCRKCKSKASAKYQEEEQTSTESSPSPRYKCKTNALGIVEQDRLAFLQYRLEQQDEEIKSFRRQHALSPHHPSSTRISDKSNGRCKEGQRNAAETVQNSTSVSEKPEEEGADLETFLADAKKRIAKLETASAKVDEIVQEVFTKKQASASLSEQFSAMLNSERMTKAGPKQLISHMNIISGSAAFVPLSRYQIPENQPSFFSKETIERKNWPSYNNYVFSRCQRNIIDSAGFSPPISTTGTEHPKVEVIYPHRSQKTVDKQLQLARNRKEIEVERHDEDINARNAPQKDIAYKKHDHFVSHANGKSKSSQKREEIEGSKFHLASKRQEEENRQNSCSFKDLKERSLRHRALSKEKVTSSDELENDENSKSISLSESIKMRSTSREQLVLQRSSDESQRKQRAIVKSIVKVDSEMDQGKLPEKGQIGSSSRTSQREKRQLSQPSTNVNVKAVQATQETERSFSSSSSSKKEKTSAEETLSEQGGDQYDGNSVSISAPISEDDNGNDEFWRL